MYSYALLEKNCYYLIQETEESSIGLIKVNLETEQCMYVSKYADEPVNEWKKKEDPIFDILELVSDDKIKDWQTIYNDNQGSYNYEEDED
jgi:S-adenosylmethionine:tRNA-ribosyltransferase-isomerase (queuine synthetase)